MNAKIGLTLGAGAGVAVVAGLLYFAFAPVEDMAAADYSGRRKEADESERPVETRKFVDAVKPSISTQTVAKVERERRPPKMSKTKDWYEDLPSAKDRAIGKHIQDAIDNNDLDATKAAAAEALSSSSVAVRQNAVEALNWFGKDAIVEMTKYLNDKDPEVARSAVNAWDAAVEMMDNDANRAKLVGMAMKSLTDKESLRTVSAKLEASEDRRATVDIIVDIVESGNKPAADAAKQSYLFIMGEPYESASTARAKALLLQYREEQGD